MKKLTKFKYSTQVIITSLVTILIVTGISHATTIGNGILTNGTIEYGDLRFTQEPAPSAATATVNTTAGNLNGNYCYVITLVTSKGETEGGTMSTSVWPSNEQVDLTNIPTGSSKVIARKIYRSLACQGDIRLVTTINNNTDTTYTDNIADGSLGDAISFFNSTGGAIYIGEKRSMVADGALTALGVEAGLVNTGTQNTFIGASSGKSNTIGSLNATLGYNALQANTTGNSNIAVGNYTLYKNTIGNNNIAIGASALLENIDGIRNTAVGMFALNYNTSGDYNTSVGSLAGIQNTTGDNNVNLGSSANYWNLTGSRNVILGTEAGLGSDYHSKDGNVFLGYRAGYNEENSNKLYITNSETTATSTLIYGEFDNNILSFNASIGIGTTTPQTNLHIFDDQANTQITIEGYNPMLRLSDTLSDTNNKNWALYGYQNTLRGTINPDDWSGGDTNWLEVIRSGEDNVTSVNFPNGNVGIGTTTPDANLQVYGGDSATSTVEIGGSLSNKGACMKLRDNDGAGWTYCTFLNGAMTCSIDSCE